MSLSVTLLQFSSELPDGLDQKRRLDQLCCLDGNKLKNCWFFIISCVFLNGLSFSGLCIVCDIWSMSGMS